MRTLVDNWPLTWLVYRAILHLTLPSLLPLLPLSLPARSLYPSLLPRSLVAWDVLLV